MSDSFDYRAGFMQLVAVLRDTKVAGSLMCSEADDIVRLLASAGMHDDAITILQEHVMADDSYDTHAQSSRTE